MDPKDTEYRPKSPPPVPTPKKSKSTADPAVKNAVVNLCDTLKLEDVQRRRVS